MIKLDNELTKVVGGMAAYVKCGIIQGKSVGDIAKGIFDNRGMLTGGKFEILESNPDHFCEYLGGQGVFEISVVFKEKECGLYDMPEYNAAFLFREDDDNLSVRLGFSIELVNISIQG